MNKLFDNNGFAIKDCRVKVYNYTHEDNEYYGSTFEHVVEGSGIPALSTLVEPHSDKTGFTQVFNVDAQKWEYVEDHRYDDVYNIETKQKEDVRYLGKLKSEHTIIAPPSQDHEFIDGSWVITDERQSALDELKKQQKISELKEIKNKLSTDMNMHLLLDEKDEAKAFAQKIKELNAEIESLEIK